MKKTNDIKAPEGAGKQPLKITTTRNIKQPPPPPPKRTGSKIAVTTRDLHQKQRELQDKKDHDRRAEAKRQKDAAKAKKKEKKPAAPDPERKSAAVRAEKKTNKV